MAVLGCKSLVLYSNNNDDIRGLKSHNARTPLRMTTIRGYRAQSEENNISTTDLRQLMEDD